MDFFFFSSLTQNVPLRLTVSYDIVCQWIRNLAHRASLYPPNHFFDLTFTYLIPKFHLPAHQASCHAEFSFNYTPFVGRTDGEAPERGWAAMNPVANSTKEMGPGSRRDTLDDHFGDCNWRKVTGMGALKVIHSPHYYLMLSSIAAAFLRKMEEALDAWAEHVPAFQEFDSTLPEASTIEWTRLVKAWETNPTEENPFKSKLRHMSLISPPFPPSE